METTKRDDFGIWPYLFGAIGCLTFIYRGIIALVGGQNRLLEGSIFLMIGLVASLLVAHGIWKLSQESSRSGETSPIETEQSSHSAGTED